MRRYTFLAVAVSALLTFVALEAFMGPRWGGHRYGWHRGHAYYHHGGFYDGRYPCDDDLRYRKKDSIDAKSTY